ncbi:HpcH/HpaI aldolase/citrate lyase family protein, partial [Streptomyces sp. NPDC127092]|uniref:HpcH/HpaI aldolase/citrate lyase family protein n=1 Tax=Streptomyces sp. NPDC127092 TaxID=3347135 RepID=UPI0036588245
LCETAAGILAAADLAAHPHVGALMWGAEDLVASMGGSSSRTPEGAYRSVVQHARATVLLAAAAHGAAAWDAVHLDLGDEAGLAAEAEDAVALGCTATVCLHPRQVPVVRSAYTPAPEAVERARRVLAAAEGRHGAFELDGAMVDEVVLAQARAVLRRGETRLTGSSAAPRPGGPVPSGRVRVRTAAPRGCHTGARPRGALDGAPLRPPECGCHHSDLSHTDPSYAPPEGPCHPASPRRRSPRPRSSAPRSSPRSSSSSGAPTDPSPSP